MLGLPAVIIFGLTYMSPVAVFTTYGIVNEMTEGHLVAAYVLAVAVMLFTANSYGRMSLVIPASGSAFKYAQHAFGPKTGFMTGWTLMLDYLFLPMVVFLIGGLYLNTQFPDIPVGVFSMGILVFVLVLNVLGVRVVSWVNAAVMTVTGILVAFFVFVGSLNAKVSGSEVVTGVIPSAEQLPLLAGGAAVLAFSFLGFDAVSTLSEETKNPRKTIPRGVMITTLAGGLIFIAVAWVGYAVHPSYVFNNVDAAGVEVMESVGGELLGAAFVAVYVIACLGAAMVQQASVSRIIFSMGRDNLLPKRIFGVLHPKWKTPIAALLVASLVGLLALVLSLEQAVVMINFGALAAFSMVNLSVIRHYIFIQKDRSPKSLLINGLLPLIGFVTTVWLWTSLDSNTFVVGLVWLAVGFIYLLVLTRFFTKPMPRVNLDDLKVGETEQEN